jgi:hypothetical protein
MIRVKFPKSRFRGTRLPWHEHPFRLISWLEMNEFSAKSTYEMGLALGKVSQILHLVNTSALTHSSDLTGEVIVHRLRLVEKACRKIALTQSAKYAARTIEELSRPDPYTTVQAGTAFDALQRLVQSELEEQLFLWIPSHRADAYTQKKAFFGKSVAERFHSASVDVEEIGKCFACGRYTASVMHCMRVLEHGLRSLCLTLELPFGEGTWKRSLQAIEARIVVLDSQVNPKRKTAWKNKRQFYAEAVAEFTHFKDAWRNHAAHGREHYGEERAEKIIQHTRSFMQVLATRLKEKKS